jgi:anti-sigma-K factor RskA/putative zinc finger protein
MTACERCHELLGGYVLAALEPAEAAVVRRHLESCPDCGADHAELHGVPELLTLLGESDAEPEPPPRELEEVVLDRFARERPRQPRRRSSRRPWQISLGFAAAAAATVGLLALAGVFEAAKPDRAFGHVRLQGAASGTRAYADLRAVRAGTGVDLRVRGLTAGGGRVYEVWCIPDNGRWISGGTFHVDGRGRARVKLTSAARPGDYELMLVTQRPAGESRGTPVLRGRVEY